MGLDASTVLGSPELAGTKVNPRGTGKAIMAKQGGAGTTGAAGMIGMAIGKAAASTVADKKAKEERASAATSTAPDFHFIAYLAVTESELALVGIESPRRLKLTEPLARVPRSNVTSIELGKAAPMMAKPLTIHFADGGQWILEVPALVKGDAKKLVAQLEH